MTHRNDIEGALTEAIVKVYAKKLATAWNAGDSEEVSRILAHISTNYGQEALGTVGRLATAYACGLDGVG